MAADPDLVLNEILLEGTDTPDVAGFESADDSDPYREREAPYGSDDGSGMETFDDVESTSDYSQPEAAWATGYENPDDPFVSGEDVETLAYELVSLDSEQQLEAFLGKIFKSIKKKLPGAAKFLRGPGRALLARALPLVGSAAGSIVPGLGTALGGAAGSALASAIGGKAAGGGRGANPLTALLGSGAAGNILGSMLGGGMEAATLQEAKLDVAKRLVRTVADAASSVASDPDFARNAGQTARSALTSALQRNVPPAIRATLAAAGTGAATGRAEGRWVRKGNRILLLNV